MKSKPILICLFAGSILLTTDPAACLQTKHADPPGIRGSVALDTSVWAPTAYLSVIPDFTQMHTMSYETIIQRAGIDSIGYFSFDGKLLPEEDRLYRVHFSKKNDPPASLIIGSRDENHFFMIANSHSDIALQVESGYRFIESVNFSGYAPNPALQEVNRISAFIDTLDYYGSDVNREFIRDAVFDKLRVYADTCSHPLVALYAIYRSRFESDYPVHPSFYKAFLRKWRHHKTDYFKVFTSQLPPQKSTKTWMLMLVIMTILAIGSGIAVQVLLRKKSKHDPFKTLTVQERKIFMLLKEGKSNKEIAEECAISLSTVKSHVNNIFGKLKVGSRREVMNYE